MGEKYITERNFSFAWSRFAKSEVKEQWHKDSFSYFQYIPEYIIKGNNKIGLDVGCGSGADMINLAQHGSRIIGVDISDAINITYENIRHFNGLHVLKADVYNLPFKDDVFDFVYSLGVLHHLPEPEKCFRAICSKARRGGFIIIYVYEDFLERTAIERKLLRIINSLRIITVKLPPQIIYILCVTLAPFVLLFCSIPYRIMVRFSALANLSSRMPFRHTVRLDCIIADLYDRFSSPIEYRYKRDDVERWFKMADLDAIEIINYRGWVAWGKKK